MPRRIPHYIHKWYNTMTDKGYVIQLMLLIVLLLLLFFLVESRQSNQRLIQISESSERTRLQNQSILKEVLSCTTPDGECSKRGAQNSVKAIDTINKVTIYASYCAAATAQENKPVTADAVKTCVQKNLEIANREGR